MTHCFYISYKLSAEINYYYNIQRHERRQVKKCTTSLAEVTFASLKTVCLKATVAKGNLITH